MADLTGQDVERYHIIEPLGKGGMAVVYKAFDRRLEREVAIKFIRTERVPPDELGKMLARFEREGKALARMEHPHIIRIFDYGEHEGMPYLVMNYLPGGTLKTFSGQQMAYQKALKLLLPIARALDYAHQQGVVHRDVKPANILISKQGDPLLSDFGIARILEDEGGTLTGTGIGIGTPEYMAPEQCRGEVTPAVDIYALGVVLYELITGNPPYQADTPLAVMIKQARDPLLRPSLFVYGLPGEVDQFIFRALAKEPKERYASMGEMVQAMEKLLALNGNDRGLSNHPVPQESATGDVYRTSVMMKPAMSSGNQNQPPNENAPNQEVAKQQNQMGNKPPAALSLKDSRHGIPVFIIAVVSIVAVLFCCVILLGLGWLGQGPAAGLFAVSPQRTQAATFPASDTPVQTPTIKPSLTATLRRTSTLTPTPTATLTPLPTSTATPTRTLTPSPPPQGLSGIWNGTLVETSGDLRTFQMKFDITAPGLTNFSGQIKLYFNGELFQTNTASEGIVDGSDIRFKDEENRYFWGTLEGNKMTGYISWECFGCWYWGTFDLTK